jgi:hypothetical protein
MELKVTRRLLVALALLPLLAGAAVASSQAMFLCQGDRTARVRCCCPNEVHAPQPPRGARAVVSAACCCDATHVQGTATPVASESRAVQTSLHLAAASAALPTLPPSPSGRRARTQIALAQPPPAIPLLLAKQSFLV